MGKLLIVALLVIGSIFVLIILSVQDRTEEVPELLSSNLAELQAKALCREALVYGMNKISSGAITISHSQPYTNFEVLEGTIDSIQYISNTTNDTIEINTYTSYQVADDIIQHKSSAIVCWVPTYAQSAMSSNGDINVGGNADITGDLITNADPPLSFEDLFGITKVQMEAIADTNMVNPSNNPEGVEGITWVSFTHANSQLKVTTADWEGSGILVVDGDASFSGGSFEGIMWITGTLFINGNNGFDGAVYCEGGIEYGEIEDVEVLGTCQITYDFDAILEAFSDASLDIDYELKINSMFEDN